jgi:hypothetical protein
VRLQPKIFVAYWSPTVQTIVSHGPSVAVGTTSADRPPQSGRTVARSGLRRMPTFPPSPLSFRTAGFPQYGWKAGLSDGAFPMPQWLKPAPGIRQLRYGLHPPFAHLIVRVVYPALCRAEDSSMRRLGVGFYSTPGALAPVRVLLSRAIHAYSAPSDPLLGTSRFRRPCD